MPHPVFVTVPNADRQRKRAAGAGAMACQYVLLVEAERDSLRSADMARMAYVFARASAHAARQADPELGA